MVEARSLTPLSETDYEAIAAAVMETARGRWFMAEFAKRNRQADTAQLLTAIGRIERVVGVSAQPSPPEPSLREAAALITDLRLDLERISGRNQEPSSGLAARIEGASGTIAAAVESIQEAAWGLREAGADEALCDMLDRRATEINAATTSIDGTAQQIGKIADTIAMLDSSLRAFCESAQDEGDAGQFQPARGLSLRDAAPLGAYDDVEIIEIDEAPTSAVTAPRKVSARPTTELKHQASSLIHDDVDFEYIDVPSEAPPPAPVAPPATSEADLREIDALRADKKLAYFA
ncbi:hypothetical protein [Bosea sp. 685]|uniref:hypothetical protein n=1 Tax=Bosea sp. 685 TaxID=3080057 RepID=UPI002892CC30|nr:hypothetical protein [Bosea sp. 685]WNJ89017.1 hypothetical protein RMR04_21735 [Bosea sp. 685]